MPFDLVLRRVRGWTTQDTCRCTVPGHRLLTRVVAQPGSVSDQDGNCPQAIRRIMHDQGLLVVTEAAQAGWKRGAWMAILTPAGMSHYGVLVGNPDAHLPGCGASVGVDGDCGGCGGPISLTTQAAQRRIDSIPAGPERDREIWAAQFVCPVHGRCRNEMVTTKKTCAWCNQGLYRYASMTPVD